MKVNDFNTFLIAMPNNIFGFMCGQIDQLKKIKLPVLDKSMHQVRRLDVLVGHLIPSPSPLGEGDLPLLMERVGVRCVEPVLTKCTVNPAAYKTGVVLDSEDKI